MPHAESFFLAMIDKTRAVGLNARGAELVAAWESVSASPLTLMLGGGWGATFESPAVAGIRVNYTHGLLGSALLKTGLVGIALSVGYIAAVIAGLLARLKVAPVLVLALAGPILIDTFLYASFKSLDFGLVLLLACAVPQPARDVA